MKILYINTYDPYKEHHGGATVTRSELESLQKIYKVETLFGQPLKSRWKKINIIRFIVDILSLKSIKLASYSTLNKDESFYEKYDLIFCNHDFAAYDYQKFIKLNKRFIVRKHNLEYKLANFNGLIRAYEKNRILNFEKELGIKADSIIHISKAEYLEDTFSKRKYHVYPPLLTHNKSIYKNIKIKEKKIDILCVSNFNWHPNIEGINWFIKEINPFLIKNNINVSLVGLGSEKFNSPVNFKAYGYVDDLKYFYSNSKIFIAPILSGAGIKIKVIEALVNQMPVISTKCAIEGLEQIEEYGAVFATDEPGIYTDKIVGLLNSADDLESLSYNSRRWAEQFLLTKEQWSRLITPILENR